MTLLLVLLGVAAVAVVATVGLVGARGGGRFRELAEAWRRYAAAKGVQFVAPVAWKGLLEGAAPALAVEAHGVAVHVTVEAAHDGNLTRASAALPNASASFVAEVRRRGGASVGAANLTETRTGNATFDATFALHSNEPDVARSLLDRRLAQVLSGFPREAAWLVVEQNRLSLVWQGIETEAAVLDAAIDVVGTACRRRA